MGLFESVQLELFEFLGIPKNANNKKANKGSTFKNPQNQGPPSHWNYEIDRKAYKRGLSFRVLNNGILKILAPKSLSEDEIFSEVLRHTDWVEVQIKKSKDVKARFPQKKWRSGEKLPVFGKDKTLNIQMTATKKPQVVFLDNEIDFFVPYDWQKLNQKTQEEKMAKAFKKAFKEKFSYELSKQVDYWSKMMGLYPKDLKFKDTKTQWGSCTSMGTVCLNWKIGVFDKEISDYVIVHELSHLKHQNHSRQFWSLVEEYTPNRKAIMKKLNHQGYKVDFLSKKSELYVSNPVLT